MADQALDELCAALRRLQLQAGEPSTRDIAKEISYSHTTVAQILNGTKCPKWPTLNAVVLHLGGNPDEFKKLWVAARSRGDLADDTKDAIAAETDDEDQEASSDDVTHARRTVLRFTRTTMRDGTRSEALEIFDRETAREWRAWIESHLQDTGDDTAGAQ